ncbi:hypothetical protein E4T47_04609, partial [Aureobasidium subglaciale]
MTYQCHVCPDTFDSKHKMTSHLGRQGAPHNYGPWACRFPGCAMRNVRRGNTPRHDNPSGRGTHAPRWAESAVLKRQLVAQVLANYTGALAPAAQAVAGPVGGQLGGGANPAPMPAPIVAAPVPLPALGQGVAGHLAPGQGQVGPADDDDDDDEDEEDAEEDESAAITQDDGDDAEAGEEDEDNEGIAPSTPP